MSLLTAAACCAAVAAFPAQAQLPLLGGGRPQIPEIRVLDSYDATVVAQGLNIAPVSAGLAPVSTSAPESRDMGIDDQTYTETRELLQVYINALAGVGPRPDVVPQLKLQVTPTLDAFTPSNDLVVITTGMLAQLFERHGASQEEFSSALGFILAHEYAHVLFNHPALYAEREEGINITGAVNSALVLSSQMQGLTRQISPDLARANLQATSTLGAASGLSPLIQTELFRFAVAPYRREQESLADFMAADLMRRHGEQFPETAAWLNPDSGAGWMGLTRTYDNSVRGQLRAGLDHLNSEMQAANRAIADQTRTLASTGNLSGFMRGVQGSLLQGLGRWVLGIFQRRVNREEVHAYFSADRRMTGVSQYMQRHYQPLPELVSDELAAGLAGPDALPSVADLSAAYARESAPDRAAQEATLALARGDVPAARAALAEVDPARVALTRFHLVDGLAWLRAGDLPAATESFRRAVAAPDAGPLASRELFKVLVMQGDHEGAAHALDAAEARHGVREFAVERVQLLVAREAIAEAQVQAAGCAAYGRETLERCLAAIPAVEEENSRGGGLLRSIL
ncbi:M48 family metalloprotease [Alteraurantiacibacter palmitatis]|uniref:M48 family metalloprotease n=1 Tax=Alteraurantiacibacter palmitatis TaxID=2054628 RepID=A0ABV7EAR3_9SPHN